MDMWGYKAVSKLKGVSGIYRIINLVNTKSYVGCSKDLAKRIVQHLSPSKIRRGNQNIRKAFRKYGTENFFFELIEVHVPLNKLAEREIYHIAKLRPEYNMTSGGKGTVGHIVTPEVREVLRQKGKAQWQNLSDEKKEFIKKHCLKPPQFGHTKPQSTKDKIRASLAGRKQSKEFIEKRTNKMTVSMRGNKNGNKAVLKIKNGLPIEEFSSIKSAAKSVGIHPSGITGVLKGKKKTAGGFSWKYK